MTTTATSPRDGRVLLKTALVVAGIGAVICLAAFVVVGPPAGWSAAIALALVVAFFGTGAVILQVVARVVPAMALLVALMTFTLQVVLIGLAFMALRRAGMLDDGTLDPKWLAGTMLALTAVWLVGHVRAATTARIPVYDLAQRPAEAGSRMGDEGR